MAGGWVINAAPGLIGWQVWRDVSIFFRILAVGTGLFVLWAIRRLESGKD